MNVVSNYLNKKIVFSVLLLAAAAFSFSQWYAFDYICITNDVYSYACGDVFYFTKMFASTIFYLFLPALLTLPLPKSVFENWRKFAIWAVPILFVVFLLSLFVDEGNGYYSFGFTGFALLVLYVLYALVSLGIIIVSAIRAWRT
jgi:hypothetical protein